MMAASLKWRGFKMIKDFPVAKDHDSVFCFNCGDLLGKDHNASPSGFFDGNGAWQKWCFKCTMTTYYDVEV